MMAQVNFVKNTLHPLNFFEFLHIFLINAPRLRQLMFDSLKPPEKVKNLFVVFHDVLSENCG
jgi:hypothetical protein